MGDRQALSAGLPSWAFGVSTFVPVASSLRFTLRVGKVGMLNRDAGHPISALTSSGLQRRTGYVNFPLYN